MHYIVCVYIIFIIFSETYFEFREKSLNYFCIYIYSLWKCIYIKPAIVFAIIWDIDKKQISNMYHLNSNNILLCVQVSTRFLTPFI